MTPTAEGANCAGGPFTVTVAVQPQPLIAFPGHHAAGRGSTTANHGGQASLDAPSSCGGDQLTLSGFNRNLGTVGLLQKRTSSGNLTGVPADEPEADIPPEQRDSGPGRYVRPIYSWRATNSGSLTRVYNPRTWTSTATTNTMPVRIAWAIR